MFITPFSLTIIHSDSVNSVSLYHHKFILVFLITGPHTELIFNLNRMSFIVLLYHTFI